jgi:hypothetical protein
MEVATTPTTTLVAAVVVATVAWAWLPKGCPWWTTWRPPGVICQLCGKKGHTVVKCYKRFDASFTGAPQKSASSATSHDIDTNWYVDSGTTDHVTSELEKLTIRDKYGGHDQVHSASGAGMEIDPIRSSNLEYPF